MRTACGARGRIDRQNMRGLSTYFVRQILGPLIFFTVTLTGVIWLTQSLRLLDVVINRGQSAAVFFELTALLLPSIMELVLPVSLFCATLYALHRMISDSEIVVLWSAGLSRWSVARPILATAAAVAAVLYLLGLYLAPAGLSALQARVVEVRADLASTILREGTFNTPSRGLTVYISGRSPNGDLLGIMVHDNRDPDRPVTYMAERGALVKTPEGPRLVMVNGNIQRVTDSASDLALLYFDQYSYDLSQFTSGEGERWKEPSERFLPALFNPANTPSDQANRHKLIAEGHNRLTAPLYSLALTLIAIAAMLSGRFGRRGYARRIVIAMGAAILIRLIGLALVNMAGKTPALIPLLYAVPLIAITGAALMLTDRGERFLTGQVNRRASEPGLATGE